MNAIKLPSTFQLFHFYVNMKLFRDTQNVKRLEALVFNFDLFEDTHL